MKLHFDHDKLKMIAMTIADEYRMNEFDRIEIQEPLAQRKGIVDDEEETQFE